MLAYTFKVYIFFKTCPNALYPLFFMQQPKQPNPAPATPKTYSRCRHAAPQWQMQLHQMQDKSKQPPNVLVVAV
jgi:hypothetical protein